MSCNPDAASESRRDALWPLSPAAGSPGALQGVRVLDFSGLLPGPLATLFLAEAGADVLKVERPGTGDDVRRRQPAFGTASAQFALLNRGKRSIAVDLKDPNAVTGLSGLIEAADVLVEQFRPGVMDKLGLGFEALRARNPRLVYCSITGYGQSGARADVAGHDLNYVAESGLLSLAAAPDGTPAMSAALVGDIAGGSYPAVINILLALMQRARTGVGCHLDIAMAEGLFPFLYWALARGFGGGTWPAPGANELTGTSPRYRTYRTRDGRHLAVGALEDRFWTNFCDAVGLPGGERAADALAAAVASRVAEHTADEWDARLRGLDVCASVVRTVEEAARDRGARGTFAAHVTADGDRMPALPLPLAAAVRADAAERGAPSLGDANAALEPRP